MYEGRSPTPDIAQVFDREKRQSPFLEEKSEDKKFMLPNITLNSFVSPRSGHKPMTIGQIRILGEDNEAKPPTPKRGHELSPNRLRVGYNQVNEYY